MLAKNNKQKLILFVLLITTMIIAGCSANQTEQINDNSSTSLENQSSAEISEKNNKSSLSIEEQDIQSELETKPSINKEIDTPQTIDN
ncbi:hypothetical protein GM661_03280 [Iocasia frigidifontis]|uniref:Lipoprotein n=1 Tax=Iocasia fonsfrigidae TaxID=2682810 RepID=A0A8A7KBW9_9FIRM|nr:hypothetical protein [Iocasia fonsfrigidae]QTL97068.1 hypothetical protein GM661_03280 [Iocasia fonsfrigidae]